MSVQCLPLNWHFGPINSGKSQEALATIKAEDPTFGQVTTSRPHTQWTFPSLFDHPFRVVCPPLPVLLLGALVFPEPSVVHDPVLEAGRAVVARLESPSGTSWPSGRACAKSPTLSAESSIPAPTDRSSFHAASTLLHATGTKYGSVSSSTHVLVPLGR